MRGQAPRFPLFADDKNKIGGRHMKTYALVILLLFAAVVPLAAADLSEVKGTYSGSWTPKEGVPEAVTVELKEGQSGTLTGRFLTPALMEFTKSSFNTKANAIVVEAVDQKTGK